MQTIWAPQSPSDSLHIFAEPDHKDSNHGTEAIAIEAFALLISMLGSPQLEFVSFKLAAIAAEDTGVPEPEEEVSLSDRRCRHKPGLPVPLGGIGGGEVANCVGVFV